MFGLQSFPDFRHTKGTGLNKIQLLLSDSGTGMASLAGKFALFVSPRLLLGHGLEEAVT